MKKGNDKFFNKRPEDTLFSERIERRFLVNKSKISVFINQLKATEDMTLSQWVTNIYFNTSDQTLPIGSGVRFREYSKFKKINLKNRIGFIDYNYVFYDKKFKIRKTFEMEKVINELNLKFKNKYSDFRRKFVMSYKRRVFLIGENRVTIDFPIECFEIMESFKLKKISIHNFAYIEIKQKKVSNSILRILKNVGAVPTIHKYFLMYNQEYYNKAEKKYSKYIDESNGFEYELKLSKVSEDIFNEYIIKVKNGYVKEYKIVHNLPDPFCFASFNEYRFLKDSDSKMCIMYDGNIKQRISIKDNGEILKNKILKRRKENKILSVKIWSKLVKPEIIGRLFRIKKIFFIQSVKTGVIYGIILDLSQNKERSMYQLEIEYAMSINKLMNNFEETIINEIQQISKYFTNKGFKKTLLRKQDWVRK